nr:phosphatidate cytidylyltransferase [Litorihabitans aurantiacus]
MLTADVGRTSRAGRNVPVAAGVGVALVLALVASLFWRKEAFGILAFAAVLGALVELRAALARQQIILPVLPIAVGAVGMFVSAYLAGTEALLVAFVLTAGGVVVWCALDGGGLRVLRNATAAIFVAAYVPFLASFLALALAADDGEWRVLAVVVLVVAGDTGGWAAGVLIGRHPLAPTISPKKSWEGLGGSVVLAVAIGTVGLPLVLDVTWWQGALVGLLAVIAGLVGDLGESLIKRDLGMKDMGDSIPGHGGILDRVDALLVAAPVVVTALAVAAPIA